MSQNISLERSAQSAFSKAVKNINSLLKKKEIVVRDEAAAVGSKSRKSALGTAESKSAKQARRLLGRGIVFLSHIPPGFYEKEMYAYFNQFGRVTRIKLARSKKTGNPKGFAFIEFLYSEVAQVVAETMNNYLMGGRLLKAEYMPGGKPSTFFIGNNVRPSNCPRVKSHKIWNRKTNKVFTDEEEMAAVSRERKRVDKLKKELEANGIELDCQMEGFLQPWKEDRSFSEVGEQSKLEGEKAPVLEIDESDEEVQFKVHPKVKVLKRKSTANASGTWQVKLRQASREKPLRKKRKV